MEDQGPRATRDDDGSGTRPRHRDSHGSRQSRGHEPLPSRVEGLPFLPPSYAAAVDDGMRDLGLSLDPTVVEAIAGHVRLLLAWTASINLTAVRDPAEAARLHVVDSLAAVPLLRAAGIDRFVDLGSGGGFPGIPLAIALPARHALLVDSVAKKARFLGITAAALGVDDRVHVAAARAEALAGDPGQRERWPAVTARAVAPLAELVELAFPLLQTGGLLVAWKRGDIDPELAAAERAAAAAGGATFQVVDPRVTSLPRHVLVVVTKRGRTDARFPRDPAERRRRPW